MRSATKIEEFFRRRYEKEAIFLPSGRLALYLAFREWLPPGARLLLSPVNDDVVLFTVLAAGLVPVVGPLDPQTGNLDPDAVPEDTWKSLSAVMTTNLYGIPDRMERLVEICDHYGLVLIEDACQAIDTRVGSRLVGEFSSVSVFSLSKHVDGVGGVLAFSEEKRRTSLLARAQKEILESEAPALLRARGRDALRALARATGTLHTLRRIRHFISPAEPERTGHRMNYATDEVVQAQSTGSGLEEFDRWLRVDNANYRTASLPWVVDSTLRHLENLEENRRRRMEGTKKLLQLGLTPDDIPMPRDSSLLRVPLFVQHREEVIRHFMKPRFKPAEFPVGLDYIYDPPLDVYASSRLAEKLPSPVDAGRWSQDVLPVNPLRADRFIDLLNDTPVVVAAPCLKSRIAHARL